MPQRTDGADGLHGWTAMGGSSYSHRRRSLRLLDSSSSIRFQNAKNTVRKAEYQCLICSIHLEGESMKRPYPKTLLRSIVTHDMLPLCSWTNQHCRIERSIHLCGADMKARADSGHTFTLAQSLMHAPAVPSTCEARAPYAYGAPA